MNSRQSFLKPLLLKPSIPSTWHRPLGLGLLVLGILALGFALRPRHTTVSTPTLPPLPQDPDIQVYFNQAESQTYPEPYRDLVRAGDDLEALLLEAIASAQSQIDIAVQELRLPRVAQALVERQQAGVKVRLVLENQYNQTLAEWATQPMEGREQERYGHLRLFVDTDGDGQVSAAEVGERDAIAILRQAKIPILDDRADGSQGSGLMHHKFAIIDGKTLVTGSANWTVSDIHQEPGIDESRGNANHMLRITSPALAQPFSEEFKMLWGDGPGGKPDSRFGVQKPVRPARQVVVGASSVVVQFSPTGRKQPWTSSTNGLIAQVLSKAKTRVDLALFVFSEQGIVDAIAQTGVPIRALIDPGFAFRDYSEALDMLGVAKLRKNCTVEPNNRPWSPPATTVGVPQLPEGDSLHHKFAILDGQAVITGSHNWSKAANEQNDETLLVIENGAIAAHFNREFERLYRDASLGLPVAVQEQIAADEARCRSAP